MRTNIVFEPKSKTPLKNIQPQLRFDLEKLREGSKILAHLIKIKR